LGDLCVDNLKPLIPDARHRFEGCCVLRTPIAYPVFLSKYETERQAFANGTGVENLYSVGRNGEFMHIFMEDVHERTTRKMQQFVEKAGSAE
jgi:hypothetical protein